MIGRGHRTPLSKIKIRRVCVDSLSCASVESRRSVTLPRQSGGTCLGSVHENVGDRELEHRKLCTQERSAVRERLVECLQMCCSEPLQLAAEQQHDSSDTWKEARRKSH